MTGQLRPHAEGGEQLATSRADTETLGDTTEPIIDLYRAPSIPLGSLFLSQDFVGDSMPRTPSLDDPGLFGGLPSLPMDENGQASSNSRKNGALMPSVVLGAAEGDEEDRCDNKHRPISYAPSSASSFNENMLALQQSDFPMPPGFTSGSLPALPALPVVSTNLEERNETPEIIESPAENRELPKTNAFLGRSLSGMPSLQLLSHLDDKPKRRGSFLGISGLPKSKSKRDAAKAEALAQKALSASPLSPSAMASARLSPMADPPVFSHARNSSDATTHSHSQSISSTGSLTSPRQTGPNKIKRVEPAQYTERPLPVSLPSLPNLGRTTSKASNSSVPTITSDLPRFPSRKSKIQPFTERAEFLLKHQAFTFSLKQRHGTWKPRLVSYTRVPSGGDSYVAHLHIFKSNGPDEFELERLRFTKESVVCVTDELSGGKLFVLKVTGQVSANVSYSTTTVAPAKEESWFFSMNDVPDLTNWMKLLKGTVLLLRGVSPAAAAAEVDEVNPIVQTPTNSSSPQTPEDSPPRTPPMLFSHPYAMTRAVTEPAKPFPRPHQGEDSGDMRQFPFHHRRNQSYDGADANLLSADWRHSVMSMSQASDDSCLEPHIARRLSSEYGPNLPPFLLHTMNGNLSRNRKRDSWASLSGPNRQPPPSMPLPPLPTSLSGDTDALPVPGRLINRQSTYSTMSDASAAFSFNSTSASSSGKRVSGSSMNSAATPITVYSSEGDFSGKGTPHSDGLSSPPRPVRNPLRSSPSLKEVDRFDASRAKAAFVSGSVSLGQIQPSRRPRPNGNGPSLGLLEEERDVPVAVEGKEM